MKGTSLAKLLQDILPELLNKIIARGSISLHIKWNGQEFSVDIDSDTSTKHEK